MNKPVFIYGLYEDDDLRYIGQSVNPRVRLINHQSEARAGASSPCGIWLRRLQEAGRTVRLVVLAETDAQAADALERDFIARHAASCRLVNASLGGSRTTRSTTPGRPLSETVTTRKNGQVVRRLVALELGLDRQLRQVIARDGLTYRSAIEEAVRGFLARQAS